MKNNINHMTVMGGEVIALHAIPQSIEFTMTRSRTSLHKIHRRRVEFHFYIPTNFSVCFGEL